MRRMLAHCGPWRGAVAPMFYNAEVAERAVPSVDVPVDIYEDESSIVLNLEVAGVDEKEISIQLQGTNLVISGERKLNPANKQENFRRIERRYGSFQRTFRLPTRVESEGVSASYSNGVLQVTLAKKPETKPRTIPVGGAAAASAS